MWHYLQLSTRAAESLVYVDDILVAARTLADVDHVKTLLTAVLFVGAAKCLWAWAWTEIGKARCQGGSATHGRDLKLWRHTRAEQHYSGQLH